MKNGVYYSPRTNQILIVSNSRRYEDWKQKFSIITWEQGSGVWKRVLIEGHQYKLFKYLGPFRSNT